MANFQFIQDVLYTKPDPMTDFLFGDVSGLFLKEEKQSNVKVQVYGRGNGLPCSPTKTNSTLSEDGTTLVEEQSPISMSSSQGFSEKMTLTTSNELQRQCTEHTAVCAKDIENIFPKQRDGLEILTIGQEHSYARLSITRTAFNQLRKSVGIFPAMHSNIIHLGTRSAEVEVAPPRPCARLIPTTATEGLNAISHELSYGLRYLEVNKRTNYKKWSLRQCVIYNKTDHDNNLSSWLFISVPEVLHNMVTRYLDPCQEEAHLNPFDIHVLLLASALAMWRPYVVDLTQKVEERKKKLFTSMPRDGQPCELKETEKLVLRVLEDDVLDAILAIESMSDTIKRVESVFKDVIISQEPKSKPSFHTLQLQNFFTSSQDDIKMTLLRLQTLRSKIESTTKAVSNFLTLMNGRSLHDLAAQAHMDTRAVQALTIITILFLPVTVVLNFFSAVFVDTSSGRMELLPRWWLFLAVGIPMTVFTLIVWRLWLRIQGLGFSTGKIWVWCTRPCGREGDGDDEDEDDLEKGR